MNIYLAARYSRRLELCGYREQLRAMGHVVDTVWLNGEHQISDTGEPIGEHGESLVESSPNRCPCTYWHAPHDYCDGKPKALRIGEQLNPEEHSERAAALRTKFAEDDLADVEACDMLIAFTEPPRAAGGRNRGGRHVELGIAIGQGKLIAIVGPRENLFCWLPEITQFDTWEEALAYLQCGKFPTDHE
jgi:hypothetical protein